MAGAQNELFPAFPENENISFQGTSDKAHFQKVTSAKYVDIPDETKK